MPKHLNFIKSRLGFGCSSLMGRLSRAESLRLLACAYDHGIRHFDTARSYGYGEAESVLGEFLRGRRGGVSITTKVGFLPPANSGSFQLARRLGRYVVNRFPAAKVFFRKAASSMVRKVRFDPVFIRDSLTVSLRTLEVERVDILLLHECEADDLARPEVIDAMEQLRMEGLILTYGAGCDLGRMENILEHGRIVPPVVQFENNPKVRRTAWLNKHGTDLVLTHRAISSLFLKVHAKLKMDATADRYWSQRLGIRASNAAELSKLFINYALAQNVRGGVLFSSTSETRIAANASVANHPAIAPEVARVLEQLADWAIPKSETAC